ncbi:AAA family ATPase [Enterocloster bolteae]|uniref:AAA family ATPase n=1 Tax=Enterocloster bolteae TaxID=208479 RepID=UPI002A837077|nr:AAA family ATPase [Enterocloster bolteae]
MSFREAKAAKIGGKFLVYGESGSGKSTFQLTFPKVACIDSEAGVAHYEKKDITINNGNTYNNLLMVDNTSDLDELEEDLDNFLAGEYDGKIETLSIDSETKFYGTMQVGAQEVEEKRARKKGGNVDDANISQRSWGRIKILNLKLQQAKIDLSTKGIHIISVAQATDERDKTGEKVIGIKPDMHKSVKFDYDTVLEFYTEEDKDGIHYYARVLKDRTNVTKRGDIIENPCYDIWKDYFEGRSKLDINRTSYNLDIKSSTDSMQDKADRAEELAAEFKEVLKSLKDNKDALLQVNKLMKEKSIDLKKLDIQAPETLEELIDFAKLQLA